MPNRKDRRLEEKNKRLLSKEQIVMEFSFDRAVLQAIGPILSTDVHIVSAHEQALKERGLPIPAPVRCNLLLDTGATTSFVKHEIAEKAGLKLISANHPVHGVGVDTTGRLYMGRIFFHVSSRTIPNAQHHMWVETQIASGTLQPNVPIDGLIGRDVLQHFEMTYNGHTGKLLLRYIRPHQNTPASP